ncbi:U1 small nuclear ribonucleoprotein C-like [Canna indica]|uniref:U1 small nuclear ribonucleoprotein C n=1 Tax=Canna indica TaxID=4628 RepID=A0AAQ3KG44_9LILI|nr:U1 small nuclear ribonucleoprotein C-like [Canna indica]
MPRYYCDYCDTYLTHDSPSVRKQHNAGYKHKANVRAYYQQFEEQQTQSLIDQRIKEHLGQAAAFQQQVGATYNQHLMAMPGNRPPLPVLVPPILPMGPSSQAPMAAPLAPGVRPPILPPPIGAPGYGAVPPPGATSAPMQMNNLPRPPTLAPLISGAMPTTTNTSAPSINPMMYQGNPSSATTSYDSFNVPAAGSA